MNKVVAFFEKYAEWLALGVAGVFLLYMVYAYVVNPTDALVDVSQGTTTVKTTPGDIEPTINAQARALESKLNAPAPDFKIVVPDFANQFAEAMGPTRPRGPEDKTVLAAGVIQVRPAVPGAAPVVGPNQPGQVRIVKVLPVVPPATFVDFLTGQSFIFDPKNPENQAIMQQGQPININNVAGVDKGWVTVEFKVDMSALAAAWKNSDMTKLQQTPQAAETLILRCAVEREEMLPTGKWGNKVEVKSLGLIEVPNYPKDGDKAGEFAYVDFASKNQVEIAEPAFFQVIKGQPWLPPSVYRMQEAAKNALPQQAMNQPFDPAQFQGDPMQLTPQQRQQLYLYQQQIKRERQKQEADQRRAKAAAAAAAQKARSGGGGGGGGRRSIGGYDDYNDYIPIADYSQQSLEGVILAQARPGPNRGGSLIEEEMGGRRRNPNQRYDDAGRPIGPGGAPIPGGAGRGPVTPAAPGVDPNITLQGGVPTGPFNPINLVNQPVQPGQPQPAPGQAQAANNIVCWAHDADIVPGKTYRYRMKVLFKNPVWATNGLCANPQHEQQFVLDVQNLNDNQGWSDWSKDVRVAPTTQYFFASAKQQIARGAVLNAEVDVFKREKGDWTVSRFTVAPGDSIGQPKNGTDYTTGETLVDLRSDVREVRIITADQTGDLRSMPLSQYVNDPQYKDLAQQVEAAKAAADGNNGTGTIVPVAPPVYGTPVGVSPNRGPPPGYVPPPNIIDRRPTAPRPTNPGPGRGAPPPPPRDGG
jgi:hypothetical protein